MSNGWPSLPRSRISREPAMKDWQAAIKARLAELAKKRGSTTVVPEIHVSRGKVVDTRWHTCGLCLGKKLAGPKENS